MIINDAINEFYLTITAEGLRPKTVSSYMHHLRRGPTSFARWMAAHGVTSADLVTSSMVREYLVWLRGYVSTATHAHLSDVTIADHFRAVSRFYSWYSEFHGGSNPVRGLRLRPPAQRTPKAAQLKTVYALLQACQPGTWEGVRNRAIILFLIDTGCRAGGLCGLTDDDLHERSALLVEKGERQRRVFFTQVTADALELWRSYRSPVRPFFHTKKTLVAFNPNSLRQMLQAFARKHNVPGRVNPHSFRHAFALSYLLNGGDLASLSRILGHSSLKTTADHYARFTEHELAAKHDAHSPLRHFT